MPEDQDFFADSGNYERGMGRLSRVAGEAFLNWLSLPGGLSCLDVGCGTGSFTELLLDRCAPSAVSAIDPSEGQIAFSKRKPWASGVDLRVADAMSLPFEDNQFDAAVMALVIQYIPDREKAMSEITRVVRSGGTVAAYVWPSHGEGHPMEPMHEAVKSIGVSRSGRPGNHIRTIEGLIYLFEASGLTDIETNPIEIEFKFDNFDDYWSSQSGEIIPNMTGEEVEHLKAALRKRLPADDVGRICFTGRANGVKGLVAA